MLLSTTQNLYWLCSFLWQNWLLFRTNIAQLTGKTNAVLSFIIATSTGLGNCSIEWIKVKLFELIKSRLNVHYRNVWMNKISYRFIFDWMYCCVPISFYVNIVFLLCTIADNIFFFNKLNFIEKLSVTFRKYWAECDDCWKMHFLMVNIFIISGVTLPCLLICCLFICWFSNNENLNVPGDFRNQIE